ncbi:Ig-like domain-containing protein [Spirosoma validum]|uniref:Cellulase family glycosylhydrolase n=1 Tax=Spirosoma validum TaxID=2771355 RepID=A0A927AZ17_9BACT|nr:Ig-like domain-containing protein [Spirosoma validum]MBD2752371.1 cellulase family glycosylhydrolase [Spirosoma validum]
MKINTLLLLGLLFTSLLGSAQTPTPLAANGRLKVVGNQLTNEAGKAIQLRGMSSHGLQWFDQCYTQASVQALASNWGVDLFRAAMYVDEGGYLNNQSGLRAKINQIVDWTAQAGVYCIIDWHVLNPGNPNERLSYAIDFFRTMAQTHAGKKNVIYEICNEPNGVDWNTIKSYADQVIPVIRQYDPQAIILVGTPQWCQRPQDVLSNPLTGANAYNIMYTFHFYSASHFFQNDIKSVTNQLPLFCSEWGTSTYSGGGSLDFNNGQAWLDLMAGNNPSGQKISWSNWTFSDAGESSAGLNSGACNAQQWNNTSQSGTWVKDHILNPADDFGPPTPSVSIVSPANNTTVNIGTNLVINASVTNATATAVEFYNGSTFLGSDATSPYSWTVAGIPQGTYSFTAKALVSSGNLTSSVVTVTSAPTPNQPPTVSLTSPANNASFATPATIAIAATATDTDGSIAKVEFYNGSNKLGEDVTAPYTYSWTGMPAGTYTLTAKATDNLGVITTSAPVTILVYNPGSPDPTADLIGPACVYKNAVQVFEVNASKLANATSFSWWSTGSTKSITVVQPGKASIDFGPDFSGGQVCVGINYSASPWYMQYCKDIAVCAGTPPTTPTNQAPTVTLTSPVMNATFTAPATITLTASASDADGSIAKVEFFNGTTKIGEDVTSPYAYTWSSVGANTYALTAKATDNQGATTTSAVVTIQVNNPASTNQPPTVALTSPVMNATFTAPATINLAASASDPGGSVAKVEFFNGSNKVGESTASPYTVAWNSVSVGTYTLTAKATDNLGATATSTAITIQVNSATPPPANTSADLIGPECAAKNAVLVFDVNARHLPNATQFNWWCTGSTQSITPTQPGKATINFGPYFTGGNVCVGINYSAAPWYQSFCKNVTVCTSSSRIGFDDVADNVVFPNPTNDRFSFVAERAIQSMNVADEMGRERLKLGSAKAGQTITFGEQLSAGTYLLNIQYTAHERRTIKLLKVGR